MSPLAISVIVFLCVFGGALAGVALHAILPEHHRSAESKEVVKGAVGLIGVMSGLVLGLLIASAKGSYDTKKDEITTLASDVLLLDRVLAHYGPESAPARAELRQVVARFVEQISRGSEVPALGSESLYDQIASLPATNDAQRGLQSQASGLLMGVARTRFLLFAQSGSSISTALLGIVVFWLSVNFASFGLFAKRNATMTTALLLCALSVAGAIFLILEMDRPFEGLLRISDAPLREVFALLGR